MNRQNSTNQPDPQTNSACRLAQEATELLGTMHPAWEAFSMPDWSSLELHRRPFAEGEALELRLDVSGQPVSRGLVARDGQFLDGPTGPRWARKLATEVAEEWRSDAIG